ncbi:copper chaperone PCu(A)C [uncultured Tateyamaria sp.]|uniref:copper chaperone PCu(A)C n=1 Tax=uncultured Tateyamaria sp. TaxID=455651 RepID=UPI0026218FFE|nr:copper chaperone PCu(A)C [uncultured Tateyamaria sp.]
MSFRSFVAASLAATLLAVPAWADGIMIMDPYARAASPAAKSGAAFMVIHNTSDQDDRLIAARTDVAKRVELHTHIETGDGVMQMTEIEGGIDLPAGATHHMMRGADHVMLMGLNGSLEQDAEIEVTLVFEKAGDVVVTIPVDNARKPEAGAHGGHADHSNHSN